MLLELAIGDAYGAGFEYASEQIIHYNDLTSYIQHPRHPMPPGCYTDDTQMSIAIAEAILSDAPWTPQLLADAFVTAFRRDPREGYASRFYAFLTRMHNGQQFLAEIQPHTAKSGAAMRACPLGIFPTVPEVIEKCTLQAKITHDTADGIAAANATALMTHYFLYALGPKAEVGRFIEQHVPGNPWAEPWHGKVKSKGWMGVRAALTAIVRNAQLSTLLQDCINFTGDVDTVAAIALGAASGSSEIIPDLPDSLVANLEDGAYGQTYLRALDQQLQAHLLRHRKLT